MTEWDREQGVVSSSIPLKTSSSIYEHAFKMLKMREKWNWQLVEHARIYVEMSYGQIYTINGDKLGGGGVGDRHIQQQHDHHRHT